MAWGSFRFYRVTDGKVTETHTMQDRFGLLQQLGLVPSAEPAVHWADGTARE
jgi:hypothetical protein